MSEPSRPSGRPAWVTIIWVSVVAVLAVVAVWRGCAPFTPDQPTKSIGTRDPSPTPFPLPSDTAAPQPSATAS